MISPHDLFPQFYDNQAVRSLADSPRWTISGIIGDLGDLGDKRFTGKAPIDMRHMIETRGRIRGAWSLDDQCLVTLDEVTEFLPAAANNAFYLQAQTDGLIVVDVEPACPPAVADRLLRLPGIVYAELSMSGHGYHLLVPLPTNFWTYPLATSKKVLREEHGWYELLLEHWVTFTRRPVPDRSPNTHAPAGSASAEPEFSSIAGLYASLAEKARANTAGSASITFGAVAGTAEAPEIPSGELIVSLTTTRFRLNDPGDFAHDTSRWEFSTLARLYARMLPHLARIASSNGHRYPASEQAWLLYRAAVEVLPHRRKHDELRNGRPFLLEQAASMIADREARRTHDRHEYRHGDRYRIRRRNGKRDRVNSGPEP